MPEIVEIVVDFLWGAVVEYNNDYDWAYILGEDATPEEKAALLNEIKEKGSVSVSGRRTEEAQKAFDNYLSAFENTKWDASTAEYLEEYLTEMIETVLNESEDGAGTRLGDTLFADANFPEDRPITVTDMLNYLVDTACQQHSDNCDIADYNRHRFVRLHQKQYRQSRYAENFGIYLRFSDHTDYTGIRYNHRRIVCNRCRRTVCGISVYQQGT